MAKLFNKITKLIRDLFSTPLSRLGDVENNFINQNDEIARQKLTDSGWKIISTNARLFGYAFRIKKGDVIQEVSIREALNF